MHWFYCIAVQVWLGGFFFEIFGTSIKNLTHNEPPAIAPAFGSINMLCLRPKNIEN